MYWDTELSPVVFSSIKRGSAKKNIPPIPTRAIKRRPNETFFAKGIVYELVGAIPFLKYPGSRGGIAKKAIIKDNNTPAVIMIPRYFISFKFDKTIVRNPNSVVTAAALTTGNTCVRLFLNSE